MRIVIVFQNLFEMYRSCVAWCQFIAQPFAADLFVHINPRDWIMRCRRRIRFGVGKKVFFRRRIDLKHLSFVIDLYGTDLHSTPSAWSNSIKSIIYNFNHALNRKKSKLKLTTLNSNVTPKLVIISHILCFWLHYLHIIFIIIRITTIFAPYSTHIVTYLCFVIALCAFCI